MTHLSSFREIVTLAVFVLILHTASAQGTTDIKVKKPCPITREFFYHGKPVSPEALIDLFPSMEDGSSPDSVDLRLHPYRSEIRRDTTALSKMDKCQSNRSYLGWLSSAKDSFKLVIDSTLPYIWNAYVNYGVRANTSGGKFIVEANYNGGGTLTLQCIFILDIRGDQLIKLRSLWKEYDNRLLPFLISGNKISCGTSTLDIPLSAR